MRDTIDMAREVYGAHTEWKGAPLDRLEQLVALVRADEREQALAAPVQDSTCSETLRAKGKAYPRTCKKCSLGPCIGAPKQPPAQPAPVQPAPVPLTHRQIIDIGDNFRSQYNHGGTTFDEFDDIGFARAIESHHGITEKGQP